MAALMGILLSKNFFHGKNKLFLFLLLLFVGYRLREGVNALVGGLICAPQIHLGGQLFWEHPAAPQALPYSSHNHH
jgi:hypothetical protein